MKIVGFESQSGPRLGVVEGDNVIDLQDVDAKTPGDLGALLKQTGGDLSGLAALAKNAAASARKPMKGLKFALPVAHPGKVICLGLNYFEHLQEGRYKNDPPKAPTIFMRCQTSLAAHNAPLLASKATETFDYEAELAVIIGKRVKHLTKDNALSCIAGYSCFNDGSMRFFQKRTSQWDMGKNFDATGGFGPWMVTADELPEGAKGLRIQTRLDGQVLQDDNTSNMMWPILETLIDISQGMTLEPGDVLVTGTPSGVGQARNPPVWMKEGAVCEIDIEGVGILRNPIASEKA
jgi:acylpyruvate hydrolase